MIYEITLDSLDVELVLTALDEKAWNARTTPAGQNYRELTNNIKEQIKKQRP